MNYLLIFLVDLIRQNLPLRMNKIHKLNAINIDFCDQQEVFYIPPSMNIEFKWMQWLQKPFFFFLSLFYLIFSLFLY